jgi:hypothetical protein
MDNGIVFAPARPVARALAVVMATTMLSFVAASTS